MLLTLLTRDLDRLENSHFWYKLKHISLAIFTFSKQTCLVVQNWGFKCKWNREDVVKTILSSFPLFFSFFFAFCYFLSKNCTTFFSLGIQCQHPWLPVGSDLVSSQIQEVSTTWVFMKDAVAKRKILRRLFCMKNKKWSDWDASSALDQLKEDVETGCMTWNWSLNSSFGDKNDGIRNI